MSLQTTLKTPAAATPAAAIPVAGTNTRLGLLFSCCFISSMIGGTVSTLFSVYLPVIIKDLEQQEHATMTAGMGAWLNAALIFGWTLGGIGWGVLCDRIGRKSAFVFSTACYGLFTIGTALSSSWIIIGICRFGSGFGIGGVLVTTTILISEAFDKKQRVVLLGILSISIPVGIFSAGLINYFFPQWRMAFGVGLIPVIVALITWLATPEPMAWVRRKADVAKQDETILLAGANLKNLVTGSVIFGTALIGLWATFAWLPSWIQTLLIGSDGQKERGIGMMLMGAGGLIGGFISGWMVFHIGMKKTLLISYAACFLISAILFKGLHVFNPALCTGIALLALFFGISQGALSMYVPSLFPAGIRATATGFCFNIGRIFTATSVFFIGSWVVWLGGYGNAVFIFSFVFVIGFFVALFNKTANYSAS